MAELERIFNCSTGEVFTRPLELPPLSHSQDAMWRLVKAERDRRIAAGCIVPGIGIFDTDEAARANINGAVTGAILSAQSNQDFSIRWKLADNTVTELSGSQMIAVGVTVLAHVSACHSRSQALGELIWSATSYDELNNIDVLTGWPQ